jgi:23S rRNA (pseudouridine1915-N3)-methyltransferase
MKVQIVTVGKLKLHYARIGWNEYIWRLVKLHTIGIKHLADKYADDSLKIRDATAGTYRVGLVIDGHQKTSEELGDFLRKRELAARPVSFIIGGPKGLPEDVLSVCDYRLGLSKLTFPHDLAMVVLLEALYRASTINAGIPYHK